MGREELIVKKLNSITANQMMYMAKPMTGGRGAPPREVRTV